MGDDMKYRFQTDIPKKEYDAFVEKSQYVSFLQEAAWASVKNNWESIRCGLYSKNKLLAVCLVLVKKLPLGLCLFYVPRGYVIDYLDQELLQQFTLGLKDFAKQRHAYAIKIDPNFCVAETSSLVLDHKDEAIPHTYSVSFDKKHQLLLELGYRHQGYKKKIVDYMQPRFQMVIPLIQADGERKNIDQVRSSFKKRIRSYLGDYHNKRGVFYEYTNRVEDLDQFMELVHITEERQNIRLRNRDYFARILENYDAAIFFGKLDLEKYRQFLIETNGSEEDLRTVEQLMDEGRKTMTLSTALVIFPSCQSGRMSEYLYAANHLLFPKLQVSIGLVYEICRVSIEKNCDYCNLGGVEGTLDDHLTTFKSRFNSIILEYAGEYDYVVRKFWYYPITVLLPLAKRIYRKIVHVFHS